MIQRLSVVLILCLAAWTNAAGAATLFTALGAAEPDGLTSVSGPRLSLQTTLSTPPSVFGQWFLHEY